MFAPRVPGLIWQVQMLRFSQVLHQYLLPLPSVLSLFLSKSGPVEVNMSAGAETMMVASDLVVVNAGAVESGALTGTTDLKTTENIEIANLVRGLGMEEKERKTLHVGLGENRTQVGRFWHLGEIL